MDDQKKLKQRQATVSEIIETENGYVTDLKILINTYRDPLLANHFVSKEDVSKIFLNVDALLQVHSVIQTALRSGTEFPQVVIEQANQLRIYSVYCDGSEKALDVWKFWLHKDKKLVQWHESISNQEGPTKGLFLKDFLIKPIQRICKYPLLLRSLQETYPDGSKEFQIIATASKAIGSVLEELNAIKDQNLNIQTMVKYQKRIRDFPGVFMTPTRKFLREASLKFCKGNIHEQLTWNPTLASPITLLIFSDMLMLCLKKSPKPESKLTPQRIQPLREVNISDAFSFHPNVQTSFLLEFQMDSQTRMTYSFFCDKTADKENIVRTLKDQIAVARAKHEKKEKEGRAPRDPESVFGNLAEALCQACTHNRMDEFLQLMKNQSLPKFLNRLNSQGKFALFCAAQQGHLEIVSVLVKTNNIIIDATELETGSTPLHAATSNRRGEVMAVLLISGANPEFKNKKGVSPASVPNGEHDIFTIFAAKGKAGLLNHFDGLKKVMKSSKKLKPGSSRQGSGLLRSKTEPVSRAPVPQASQLETVSSEESSTQSEPVLHSIPARSSSKVTREINLTTEKLETIQDEPDVANDNLSKAPMSSSQKFALPKGPGSPGSSPLGASRGGGVRGVTMKIEPASEPNTRGGAQPRLSQPPLPVSRGGPQQVHLPGNRGGLGVSQRGQDRRLSMPAEVGNLAVQSELFAQQAKQHQQDHQSQSEQDLQKRYAILEEMVARLKPFEEKYQQLEVKYKQLQQENQQLKQEIVMLKVQSPQRANGNPGSTIAGTPRFQGQQGQGTYGGSPQQQQQAQSFQQGTYGGSPQQQQQAQSFQQGTYGGSPQQGTYGGSPQQQQQAQSFQQGTYGGSPQQQQQAQSFQQGTYGGSPHQQQHEAPPPYNHQGFQQGTYGSTPQQQAQSFQQGTYGGSPQQAQQKSFSGQGQQAPSFQQGTYGGAPQPNYQQHQQSFQPRQPGQLPPQQAQYRPATG